MSKLHPLTGEPSDRANAPRSGGRDDDVGDGPSEAQKCLFDSWPRPRRVRVDLDDANLVHQARLRDQSTGDPILDELWDALACSDDLASFRAAFTPFERILRDARDGVTERLSRKDA